MELSATAVALRAERSRVQAASQEHTQQVAVSGSSVKPACDIMVCSTQIILRLHAC